MPLIKSKSKAAVGENIKRSHAEGKSLEQSVAIALDTQRRAGGGKPEPNRVPQRDGMAKRLAARVKSGGAM